MTFTAYNEYKLQLLFSFWKINTYLDLALACSIVCLLNIFIHYLKYVTRSIKKKIKENRPAYYLLNTSVASNQLCHGRSLLALIVSTVSSLRVCHTGQTNLRLQHALLSALSNLLMLVAMTYNSWLFLALVVGYGIGDYFFGDF